VTDRYFALTVVLEQNIRDDDAQPLIDAIKQLRGVLSVEPHISNLDTHQAQERAYAELRKKLWEVLR
jgi:hypothetical protein